MSGRTKKEIVESTETITENEVVETVVNETIKPARIEKVEIPLTYEIPVKSNVQGGLTYISRKTGYEVVWSETGDIEYLEYSELMAMRNAHKKFFEDNWILFEDSADYTAEQVYRVLNVDKYYSPILMFENLDDVFKLSIDELKKVFPTFSKGYKENIISRAVQLRNEGNELMDSMQKAKALEEMFGFKFDEVM